MYIWVEVVESFFTFLVVKGFVGFVNTFVSFFYCVCVWLRAFVCVAFVELSTYFSSPIITTKRYI